MNIVEEKAAPLYQPLRQQNFLLSAQGVITTGILASGGFFAWFYSSRLASPPNQPEIKLPQATPEPLAQPKSKVTFTPSPIAKPTSLAIPTFSPLTESKPRIDPVIKPTFPEPGFDKPQQSSKPISTPIPTSSPTPTATSESTPSVETEPNINLTPAPSSTFSLPSPTTSPIRTFEPSFPETTSTPIFTTPSSQKPTSQSINIPPTPEVTPIEKPFYQN